MRGHLERMRSFRGQNSRADVALTSSFCNFETRLF